MPEETLHDEMHMLAAYGILDELKRLNNPRNLYVHYERALSLLALIGAVDHPRHTNEWIVARSAWRCMLGNAEDSVVYAALARIGDQVRSTEQRFTQLGIC